MATRRVRGLTPTIGRQWLPLLAVFLLAGCLPSSAPGTPTAVPPATPGAVGAVAATPGVAGAVNLTFVGSEPPETFQAAIALFQQKYPNITVTYNAVPFADLNNTIQSRLGSQDTTLDVYMADEPRIPALAARNFLLPLESARAKLAGAVATEALEAVTWDGKIWALPISTSTAVLFYNRKHLNAAGLTPPGSNPTDRWTWEQTIEAAKKAQTTGAKWGFSFQQVDRYYQLQVLPESLGAGPGLTGEGLLTPAITNEGWVEAMRWYGAMFTDGVAPRGIPVGQIPELFASGDLAFMVGNPIYIQRFRQAPGLEYGIAPQPYFAKGRPVTPTDGWALGISPFSAHKDEALKFIEFLALDPEGTTAWSAGRSLMPANQAAFDKWVARLAEQGGAQTTGIDKLTVYELTTTAIHRPRTIGYIAFEEVMNRCFADIRNGADPKARLEQAQQELTAAFARLRG